MDPYVFPAVTATVVLVVLAFLLPRKMPRRPRRLPAWLVTPWLVLAACSHPEVMAPPVPIDACGGCVAPQVCGGGCATDRTIGCYTPMGTETPGHWDCPACFREATLDAQCPTPGLSAAYSCQTGAETLGGCVDMGGWQCCPSDTCSGLSQCPDGLVSECGPGDATVACCDSFANEPTIACARPAGILFQSAACDTACKATGSVCAVSATGVTCCVDGPEDPCVIAQ